MLFRITVPHGLLVAAAWLSVLHAAAEPLAVQSEMQRLVRLALEKNPQILAVWQQVEQATALRQGNRGFFEPRILASTGVKNDPGAGTDGTLLLGGLEVALWQGAFFSVTAEENYLDSVDTPDEHFGQSILTAAWRMPLLRDRGFRVWKLGDRRDAALIEAAERRLLAIAQDVRFDVELRFLAYQEALVSGRISQAATRRVEKLLRDAVEMVKLKIVPEYQLFPARLEVDLRREEEIAAQQAREAAAFRLAAALGTADWQLPVTTDTLPETLLAWATIEPLPPAPPLDAVLKARGTIAAVDAELAAAEHERNRNRESLRPDLEVRVEGSWQGEAASDPIGGGVQTQARNVGGLVALTWQQPLGFRAERARLRQDAARLSELREQRREIELAVRADLDVAINDYRRARERLERISGAAESARKTLAAEEERFQLGEGRSRNVLDAQKDLTAAILRQTTIAVELLRAQCSFHHATGYSFVPDWEKSPSPGRNGVP